MNSKTDCQEDYKCVQEILQGEEELWEQLYKNAYQSVHSCARQSDWKHLLPLKDYDDIVDEAFARCYEHLDRYRGESRFSTWVGGYAKNIARNRCSRQQTHLRNKGHLEDLARNQMATCDPYFVLLRCERDIEKEQLENFEQGQALLTVLMQTYEECAEWLHGIQGKDEICVGELRAVGNQTDISILFFSLRGKPEKVYAFPTLRAIRNRLLYDFGLENRCYQANEVAFLSLFSWLKDEVDILKYLQGLLQLLLDRSWIDLSKNHTLRQFIAAIGNNLANHVLRFKRDDYYKVMAALPLKGTQKAPLFRLMRFEGERNTGDTYADSNSQAPYLFLSKAAAVEFAAHWANDLSCVGVDRIFWPYFKSMTAKGKVVLVLDVTNRIGKIVNVCDIEPLYCRGQ